MTFYTLRNDFVIEIQAYCNSHAESISNDLFEGVDITLIIQQRNDLLAPGPEEVHSVSCLYENGVVGVCTGVRKQWYGERHRIELVQVVVKSGFHKIGIAKYMMKEIANHFSKCGIEMVQISAEAANINAISAYEKLGFARFGTLEKGLKFDNKYSDEILLTMKIEDLLAK